MPRYLVLAGLLGLIWAFNLRFLIDGLRRGLRCEVFMHLGLALFLSIPVIELALGGAAPWRHLDSRAARLVGLLLYLPAAALVAAAMASLAGAGRARQLTESERLVSTGVFALVRQPMTLGIALWCLALVLVFQSLFSLCLAAAAAALMWLAARSETELNRRKFGAEYERYALRVPMWNIFRGLRGRRAA